MTHTYNSHDISIAQYHQGESCLVLGEGRFKESQGLLHRLPDR